MRAAWSFLIGILVLIGFAAGCVFSEWYTSGVLTVVLAVFKPLGLLATSVLSGLVAIRLEGRGTQRTPWALFCIGLGLQTIGQGVIAGYQLIADQPLPFPSLGDAFFVAASGFVLLALFSFCISSYRSGLGLGGRWSFWWPAPVVGILALGVGALAVAPVVGAETSGLGTFLNGFYVAYSAVVLIPCAVMLRLAVRFRGGRLLLVWLPLCLGMVAAMAADVTFVWLTGLQAAWTWPLVDFLYLTAYMLVPAGVAFQLALIGRTRV